MPPIVLINVRAQLSGKSLLSCHPGHGEATKEQILRAYQERTSLLGLTRTFGVARNTVTVRLKKSPEFAALGSSTLTATQSDEVLELDEMCTFIHHRRRGVLWLWLACCRRMRQIVAYALRPRHEATAGLL